MIVIAVDPHKSSHTALAVDPAGRELGQLRVEARAHSRLLRWARQWPERRWAVEGARGPERRWAVEGARGLGHGLSQWLLTEGESVVDVPARLVARMRLLSGGGKSDPADARAIALAAQPLTALRAVRAEDDTAVLRLLSDRRDELTQERTRVVNRLHRLLRELRPGGGPPGSPPIARRRSYAACVRRAPPIASGCVWPANWCARCGCWTATSSRTAAASRQRCAYKAAPSRASPASA